MLTQVQRAAAEACLINRPTVVPGTRAIIDRDACTRWFDMVSEAMAARGVTAPADVQEFCDIAGVPD